LLSDIPPIRNLPLPHHIVTVPPMFLLRLPRRQAHPMRMAIIEIIGMLIRDISSSDEGDEEQKKKQIKRFFELLTERYLDLNSWVRSKVLQTIIKLCE
jgi:condensin complex subunit 1